MHSCQRMLILISKKNIIFSKKYFKEEDSNIRKLLPWMGHWFKLFWREEGLAWRLKSFLFPLSGKRIWIKNWCFLQLNNFYLSSNHPDERPNNEEDKTNSQAAKTNHLKLNIFIHNVVILFLLQWFKNIYNSLKSFNFWWNIFWRSPNGFQLCKVWLNIQRAAGACSTPQTKE